MKPQSFNPYLPGYEYIPDGEPRVFDGRLYLFGSHDRFGGDSFCQNDYVCWSASVDNLTDWRYEGVIYKKGQDPLNSDGSRRLYAPDVIKGPDGRFYLYYTLDIIGVMSVAVCGAPAGQYEFYGHVRNRDGRVVGRQRGDIFQYDPGVLMDEDNRVYLYSGFVPLPHRRKPFEERGLKIDGGYFMELEQDMLTVKRGPELIFPQKGDADGTGFEGHEFFEGSSIRKVGGRYYFIYTSVNRHELCYAVSDRPDGGFTYGGTLISNGDIFLDGRTEENALSYFGNNHGSIAEASGRWYIFYHRHTNGNQYSRQACAERIFIEKDGAIKQAEMTSCGLNGGPLIGKGEYEARIACNLISREGIYNYLSGRQSGGVHPYFTQDGPDRESDSNQYIANFQDGAKAAFKYFLIDGVSEISMTVRGTARGRVFVSSAVSGEAGAEIEINADNEWNTFSAPLSMEDGVQALHFTFRGGGYFDFLRFSLK